MGGGEEEGNLRVMKVSCPLFSCLVLTRLRAGYCFSVTWNQQGSEPLHSSFPLPPPIFSHPTELYPFALFTHFPLNSVQKKSMKGTHLYPSSRFFPVRQTVSGSDHWSGTPLPPPSPHSHPFPTGRDERSDSRGGAGDVSVTCGVKKVI